MNSQRKNLVLLYFTLAGFLIDIRVYLPYLAGSAIMFVGFLVVQTKLKEPDGDFTLRS